MLAKTEITRGITIKIHNTSAHAKLNTWSVWKTNNSLFFQISNSTTEWGDFIVKLSYSDVKVTFGIDLSHGYDVLEIISTDWQGFGLLLSRESFCVRRRKMPGRYSWEILVGMCRPVLQILTLFQTKKCNFPHPFLDQTSKIHTRFQTCPLGRNYVIITYRLERKQKNASNSFRIRRFLFLFGIETINTFIHSCSSLKNHTWFQTKMGKVYPTRPQPMGQHIPI